MRPLRQIAVVETLSLRTLTTRIRSSWVIVAALTCVTIVLLSMLSMEEGIQLAYAAVGHADRAIVLSAGAERDFNSSIPQSWVGQIGEAAGVRRGRDGSALVDAQVNYASGPLTKRGSNSQGGTGLRGIGARGLEMSPEIHLVDGRFYHSGTREIIVGTVAQRKFQAMELGDSVTLIDGGRWTVVGHFSAGSFIDGDLIADSQELLAALHRTNYNTVMVSLTSASAFKEFQQSISRNPTLAVTVERHSDFWNRMYQSLPIAPLVLTYTVSALLAIGAISGILHTMHATISARAKEIAILRAVGFGGWPVGISIVLEAMVFATLGAAIGTVIDWLWCDGYAYNGAYGVFIARVTPRLLAVAVGWGLVAAFIGAAAPAAKEARLPVVDALGRA